ncbi:MAG: glycosyltransferase, partial [Puniceicoccales bacterium]
PREAQIRSIFDEVKPDLLHTNNLAWLSTQIWVHAKKQGCKVMHTLRDRRLLCPYHMFGHGLCHRRCNFCKAYNLRRDSHSKHVDQLVGVSRDVLDAHLREGLFPKAQSHVIHNGVKDLYSKPYLPTAPYTFGFLGSLSKSKGIDQLLRVWPKMPPENRLLVAGTSGSVASDQALKEKYALPNITFLGRVKPDELLSKIDILVTPSNYWEPFARSILEGFSCAIPTIASNRGGFPEVIEPDQTGWLFDCDNDDDLLQHLKKITELPTGKLEEMSLRCRERYLKDFTAETMLNNYRQRYMKLLNS